MNLKASFVSFLIQKYPHLKAEQLELYISEQLLSPFQITLSTDQLNEIKTEINSYWNLRNWGEQKLIYQFEKLNLNKPNNYSVCMSYDFHINSEGHPELIEINTNAAFLALGLELYSFLNIKKPIESFTESALGNMFKAELNLVGAKETSVAIIDDEPQKQRLFVEFLIYQQMLKAQNLNCEIFDFREIEKFKNFGLIYNRYTDFYLQSTESAELKALYNQKINFSPNSYEYFLLADKKRLIDWNLQTEISKPASLLPLYDLGKAEKDLIWQERKNLFFKPKNSYGGKQAYKGASMSRKMFDDVFNENFIAQKLSVPAEISVELNEKPDRLKYDLRCFTYKNELQLIVARLYQGQTTNLKTLGGGFAAVVIS